MTSRSALSGGWSPFRPLLRCFFLIEHSLFDFLFSLPFSLFLDKSCHPKTLHRTLRNKVVEVAQEAMVGVVLEVLEEGQQEEEEARTLHNKAAQEVIPETVAEGQQEVEEEEDRTHHNQGLHPQARPLHPPQPHHRAAPVASSSFQPQLQQVEFQ